MSMREFDVQDRLVDLAMRLRDGHPNSERVERSRRFTEAAITKLPPAAAAEFQKKINNHDPHTTWVVTTVTELMSVGVPEATIQAAIIFAFT